VGHRALLSRAWQLRAKVTFYDGLYVALAELLEVPLVTLDARLAGSPGVRADVEVLR
jgi:predicted nucleic acid-binding protein